VPDSKVPIIPCSFINNLANNYPIELQYDIDKVMYELAFILITTALLSNDWG